MVEAKCKRGDEFKKFSGNFNERDEMSFRNFGANCNERKYISSRTFHYNAYRAIMFQHL
jgi:hypothetical protein